MQSPRADGEAGARDPARLRRVIGKTVRGRIDRPRTVRWAAAARTIPISSMA